MPQDSEKQILNKFVEAYRNVDIDVAPVASEFVKIHAAGFLTECSEFLSTLSLGHALPLEEHWREYFRQHISEQYFEIIKSEFTDVEEVLRSEGSHLLLLAQRLLFREIDRQNSAVSALLAVRYPLLVLSFPEFVEKFDVSDVGARHYLRFIFDAFEMTLADGTYQSASEALAALLSTIKSPYRHASEFFEYGERLDSGKGQAVHTIYELLLEYSIRDFGLEENQYRDKLLPDSQLLKSPFSQESVEILMVFWAKVGSELFSQKIISYLPEHINANGKTLLSKQLDKEFFRDFGQDHAVATVEFPHIQQEALLLFETSLLEKQLEAAGDIDPETRGIYEEELANGKNLLWEVLHQGARDVIWDIERHNRLLPQLRAIRDARLWDKDEVQRAIDVSEEVYAGLSLRQEDLEYRISVLEKDLKNQELKNHSGKALAGTEALPRASEQLLPHERRFSEHFAGFSFRLAALGEAQEPLARQEASELVLNKLSAACAEVLTSDLYRGNAPEEFLVEDPIVSSVFDVPSHRGALADYVRSQLENNDLTQVEEKFADGKSLLQVVRISDALDRGKEAGELEADFPAHLITVVRMRKQLEQGASLEELRRSFPEDRSSLAILGERLKLEQVIRKHCLAFETCAQELRTNFLARWQTDGLAQSLLTDSVLFDIVWDWYCLNTRNHYEALIQKGVELANIKTKRVLFSHWFAGTLGKALEMYAPEQFSLLLRSKPSTIFSAHELGDFNYSDTLAKQIYTRSLADSVAAQIDGYEGEQAFLALESFCDSVFSPYRDFLRSDRYPLGEYFEACFFISVEQARLFPAQLRRLLLENWVDANDLDFYGDESVNGWLFIELLQRLRERHPKLAQSIVEFSLHDEKKRLQALRKSPLDMLGDNGEAVAHSIPTRELEIQMQINSEIRTIEYLLEQSEREASLLREGPELEVES
jgi:hypothetical protein